jgi:uncharacterized protein (DUF1501 family)
MITMLNRRFLLASGLAGIGVAAVPGLAWAAPATSKRFVFIIQRGAADGLATLAPVGDPDFIRARGDLAEESLSGTKLDGMFALHPAMTESGALFAAKQASFAHALASGYRERSHFDAQNMLESGASRPYGRDDGWMGRLLTLLPRAEANALAVAPAVPLALRGPVSANSYAPSRLPDANADLMQRLTTLYAEDQQLSKLWEGARATDAMAGMPVGEGLKGGAALGKLTADLMAGPSGARVVMLETNGWDTHFQQKGRLSAGLKQVDALVAGLRDNLGPEWSNTLVMVATEFGRTVAFNGTGGTDHGTASAAMLFGGNLAGGGTVISDWPGLSQAKLFEGRDLRPTLRFEDFVTGALAAHYTLDPANTRRTLFPDFV